MARAPRLLALALATATARSEGDSLEHLYGEEDELAEGRLAGHLLAAGHDYASVAFLAPSLQGLLSRRLAESSTFAPTTSAGQVRMRGIRARFRSSGGLLTTFGIFLSGSLMLSAMGGPAKRRRRRTAGASVVAAAAVTADCEPRAAKSNVISLHDLDAMTDLDDSLEEGAIGGAEEEVCEMLGYEMGENLSSVIGRPFEEAERQEAYTAAGFHRAQPSERPQAIWLIGPSASGKSTLAPMASQWVGIATGNYVLVDGEFFRDSHKGYQAALVEGRQKGCVWWGAYVNIREHVNEEKQRMLAAAVEGSKNLVIPSTCLRRSQCVDVAEMLLKRGYEVHVVAIYGDKEEIVKRGRKRALEQGKRYEPREFVKALQQFPPMLSLCSGRYFMMCSTGPDPFTPVTEGHGPLGADAIEEVCGQVLAAFSPQEAAKVSVGGTVSPS